MTCRVTRQIVFHRFKSRDIGVLVANVRVEALASYAMLEVQRWDEPGLGPQQGFNAELSIGAAVHAEECLVHLELGTAFYAEVNDAKRISLPKLIEACCQCFGISTDQITWRQSDEALADI
jgi:hypothetical protein